MFYVEKFTFFNCFFIGLIYFIIQQIDNYLRQIVDFIFLPFFLDFFLWLTKQKKMTFFFPLNFPWIPKQVKKIIFLSLAFSFLPFFLPIFFLSHFPRTKHSLKVCLLIHYHFMPILFLSFQPFSCFVTHNSPTVKVHNTWRLKFRT